VGLEHGPLSLVTTIEELLERESSGSSLESPECGHRDPSRWPRGTLYPQKLTLPLPTSGGRSVGIARLRTQVTEFYFIFIFIFIFEVAMKLANSVSAMCEPMCLRFETFVFFSLTSPIDSHVSLEKSYFRVGYVGVYSTWEKRPHAVPYPLPALCSDLTGTFLRGKCGISLHSLIWCIALLIGAEVKVVL
jgi:hypothetical protein